MNHGPTYQAALDGNLATALFKPVPTTEDGHCFIHTANSAASHYLHKIIPERTIIASIAKEMITLADTCMPFFSGTKEKYMKRMNKYLYFEKYKNGFVDLIPMATARCINIDIIVITEFA